MFIGGIAVGVGALLLWALWPQKKYTLVPTPTVVISLAKAKPYAMPDEKAAFTQYAGSQSCRECGWRLTSTFSTRMSTSTR